MKTYLWVSVTAALALLTACNKPNTETPPVAQSIPSFAPPAPVPEPQAVVPQLSQSDKEKSILEECSSSPVSTKPPTLDALEGLQGQMRCIENFLDTYKSTGHWQKAYADRAKVMMDSMVVIKALNAPAPSNSEADMANAQRMLKDREKFKKLKSENYYFVYRAIQEITISVHHGLFRELKDMGMRMGDPQEKVNASNRVAKQTGVWESSVDETREGGQFIVTRWVTDKSPMFLIEGYGTVSIILKIEDNDYFDEQGAFSDKCKVYLGVGQTRLSYPCAEYITGNLGREIINSMKTLIKEDMAREANKPNK